MARGFDLPKHPGAYVLLIDLPRPLELPVVRLGQPTLEPGRYVYCGSARGPGGLAARVGRHLNRDKSIHWHIDHLPLAGEILDLDWRTDRSECDLRERISATAGTFVPVAGFGSSDCKQCASHLLMVSSEFKLSSSLFE